MLVEVFLRENDLFPQCVCVCIRTYMQIGGTTNTASGLNSILIGGSSSIANGENTIITEEARLEVIRENKKRKDSILAEAIVVKTLGQRIKTNIYIKFISLYYPTQCFDIQDKAHGWLLKHVKQSRTV